MEKKEPRVLLGAKVGEDLDGKFSEGFPPQKVTLSNICAGKKIVLVGLPGAYTPT